MDQERIAKAVDKLVQSIVIECFPYDYDAGTAGKKEHMKKVIGPHLITFLEETLRDKPKKRSRSSSLR